MKWNEKRDATTREMKKNFEMEKNATAEDAICIITMQKRPFGYLLQLSVI